MGLGYVSLSKSPLSSAVRKTPTSGLPELIEAARFSAAPGVCNHTLYLSFRIIRYTNKKGDKSECPSLYIADWNRAVGV